VVNPLKDPAVLAALVQKSDEKDSQEANESTASMSGRRAAILSGKDRDMEDLDLGFGSSRFDDAEDMAMDDSKVKLSNWNGDLGGEGDDEERKGETRKKRKRNKRRGDKNSAADVLRVIEGRKQ